MKRRIFSGLMIIFVSLSLLGCKKPSPILGDSEEDNLQPMNLTTFSIAFELDGELYTIVSNHGGGTSIVKRNNDASYDLIFSTPYIIIAMQPYMNNYIFFYLAASEADSYGLWVLNLETKEKLDVLDWLLSRDVAGIPKFDIFSSFSDCMIDENGDIFFFVYNAGSIAYSLYEYQLLSQTITKIQIDFKAYTGGLIFLCNNGNLVQYDREEGSFRMIQAVDENSQIWYYDSVVVVFNYYLNEIQVFNSITGEPISPPQIDFSEEIIVQSSTLFCTVRNECEVRFINALTGKTIFVFDCDAQGIPLELISLKYATIIDNYIYLSIESETVAYELFDVD